MKNFLIFLLSALTLLSHPVNAAGPIAHAYLAECYFEQNPGYTDSEKESFMLGTLFPDIRYLGKIDRRATHYNSMSLEEVKAEKSPFIAGMKFHSYVDINRNIYVKAQNLERIIPKEIAREHRATFIKLIEDMVIYEKREWNNICSYLQKIDPEELNKGVDEEAVLFWHACLTLFFKTSPTTALTLMSYTKSNLNHIRAEELSLWKPLLCACFEKEESKQYVKRFLEHFESLMITSK